MAPLFTNFHFGFGRSSAGGGVPNISATGGNTATNGGYKYHVISSSGSFQLISNPDNLKFEAFLIAGGGGGGNGGDIWGGGGGAGGALHLGSGAGNGVPLNPGTYPVTIGSGGSNRQQGGTSTIAFPSPVSTDGGGYGGGRNCSNTGDSEPGGSAGGAGCEGGAGSANQPTKSNPAPAGYNVTQYGSGAHGSSQASGGYSAKEWTAPQPNPVAVLANSPIGAGAIGYPGTAPGNATQSGSGYPAPQKYGPYPHQYGSGGGGANSTGGTGASGVAVIRYVWNE